MTNESWAVFANAEYMLSEQWSIVTGVRYTEEDVEVDGDTYAAMVANSDGTVPPASRLGNVVYDDSRSDNDFNWKLGVNFTPNDNWLIYGSVSTGFRSGGYDGSFGSAPLLGFEPEDVTAYDVGFKATLADGSMTLNGNVFWTEIDDYQDNVDLPGNIAPRRQNIGTLETQGVELDWTWQLSTAWMIKLGGGYTDAEVVDSDFIVNGNTLEGTTPVNTPDLSYSAMVNFNQPLGDDMVLDVLISGQWQDERYLEPENAPDHLVDAYSTVDAVISLGTADERWNVSLWGRNLTDEDYIVYINDVPGFGLFLTIPAEPRTYGVTLEYNFD